MSTPPNFIAQSRVNPLRIKSTDTGTQLQLGLQPPRTASHVSTSSSLFGGATVEHSRCQGSESPCQAAWGHVALRREHGCARDSDARRVHVRVCLRAACLLAMRAPFRASASTPRLHGCAEQPEHSPNAASARCAERRAGATARVTFSFSAIPVVMLRCFHRHVDCALAGHLTSAELDCRTNAARAVCCSRKRGQRNGSVSVL